MSIREYKITHINICKLLVLTLVIIVFSIAVPMMLKIGGFLPERSILLPISLIGGPLAALLFFFLYKGNKLNCKISEMGVEINSRTISWPEIEYFIIDNESIEFSKLSIGTRSGKVYKVSQRNKDSGIGEFFDFIKDFEKKVNDYNNNSKDHAVVRKYTNHKASKWYVATIFILVAAYTYIIFASHNENKSYGIYITFVALAVSILYRLMQNSR